MLAPALVALALVVTIETLVELQADETAPSLALAWLRSCAEHPVRIAMCGALAGWAWRPPGRFLSESPRLASAASADADARVLEAALPHVIMAPSLRPTHRPENLRG